MGPAGLHPDRQGGGADRDLPARRLEHTDADPDTAFSIGSFVTTFSYTLPDSLVKVPLPAAWVAANDTTLEAIYYRAVAALYAGDVARARTAARVAGGHRGLGGRQRDQGVSLHPRCRKLGRVRGAALGVAFACDRRISPAAAGRGGRRLQHHPADRSMGRRRPRRSR